MTWSAIHLGLLCLTLLMVAMLVGCHKKSEKKDTDNKPEPEAGAMSHFDQPAPTRDEPVFQVTTAEMPAPKPTEPLPPGSSCITTRCHAQFALAPRIHAPVGAGQCDVCHDADTGDHRYPLKRTGNEVCAFCHTIDVGAHEHPPVTDPGCVTCHDPHAAPSKFLLPAATVAGVCAQCHNLPLRRFAHSPFAEGQCNLCHLPHGADNAALLRGGEVPQHCLSCHTDLDQHLADADFIHTPVGDGCKTCHDPHSTDHPRLLYAEIDELCESCHPQIADRIAAASVKHGALDQPEHCASCHDPHASSQITFLRKRQDALCLQCHDKPVPGHDGRVVEAVADQLNQPYLHGPVRSAECSACHDTHGSDYPNLLDEPYPRNFYAPFDVNNYALCFECHNKQMVLTETTTVLTDFRNGDENLHFVHVNRPDKGRTCRTCHSVHGSSHPRHIADSVPFEDSDWAMPIEFNKTADGGTCSPGCHEPRSYSRPPTDTQDTTTPSSQRGDS